MDNIWQIALALVGTVGLVMLLGYLAKRFQLTKPSQGGLLKVLDSTYLGPKEKIVLVQVANQHVLVGIAGQAMTRLTEYSAATDFSATLAQAQTSTLEQNMLTTDAVTGSGHDAKA